MQVGSYSYEPHAFKYGDKPKSHSVVTVAQRNLWQRNFNIQFDFRTFYPDGVLFVAPVMVSQPKYSFPT
jgi:laminin alpha 1/2